MGRPRILFHNDGRHPLIYCYEPPMQTEEYEAAVDELLGTPVDTLVFSLAEGRTFLHDTQVGEFWGHHVDKWPHLIWRRAYQNAKIMIEEGNDPLRFIAERAHAEGLLFYPSLNVQWDSAERGVGSIWVRTSNFRLDNKQFEIGADGSLDKSFPGFGCLDFKHPESREERFAIIEETMNRYPVDGFELNLNNQKPYYFHPNQIDQGRPLMTEWVARIHETVHNSGSRRELIIRVPNTLEGCFGVGMDVREWMRQGIVDALIVQDRQRVVNQMADFRPFVAAARKSGTRILAAVQNMVQTDRVDVESVEMMRATACNYWAQGIDGIFLDRGWFLDWPYEAPFYQKLREIPFPHLMNPMDKQYHVLSQPQPTFGEVVAGAAPLPAKLETGRPQRIRLNITDDLLKWDAVGRGHLVRLRIRLTGTTELDQLTFKLNGKNLPEKLLRKINQMYKMTAPRRRIFGYWFVWDLDRDHWPKQGTNTVEVTLRKRDPDVTPELAVRDLELDVKYLMGQNFYRGLSDPDLGPYRRTA